MPAPAIVVSGVEKTFERPQHAVHTLKERALHPLRRRAVDHFDALRDVSFTVDEGEFFGIVGRNGSGKSTLLKLMAGIYRSTAGDIYVRGRTSTFIELGVGFNPDLAARDNVYLNAIMLGLTPSEARDRYDQVIEFAELREFENLKLKNYSSGMHVRLAFSVMIQVDADVLMIDEVLAVGDAAFQQKCFDEFNRLRDEGRTIVLVTHDMSAVQRCCDRAMLIDRGNLLTIGGPHEIALAYNELNFGRLVEGQHNEEGRYGDHAAAEIKDAWFQDDSGERIKDLPLGAPCTMGMEVYFHQAIDEPVFGFHVRNEPRHTVFTTTTAWDPEPVGSFAAGESARVFVRFENWFAPQRYTISPSVSQPGTGDDLIDLREDLAAVVVHGARRTGGLVDVPHQLRVERG